MVEASVAIRDGHFSVVLDLAGQVLEVQPDNQQAAELLAFVARGQAAAASLRPFGRQMRVTFLYCDIAGMPDPLLWAEFEQQRALWAAYYDVASQVVERYDGHIVSYEGEEGNGLMIAFGYPRAHEDDARRAVHAAIGIRDAVNRLRHDTEDGHVPRIGLHTGVAESDTMENADLFSQHIAIAEQIQESSEPGSILMSEDTAALVSGFFETLDMGARQLKNFPDPVRLVQVVGASGVEDRLEAASVLTPLVGRGAGRSLLLGLWEGVRSGNHGGTVLITGDAGIGKSRLARFIRDRAAFDGHATLRTNCSPYYTLAGFHAIARMLERRCGVEDVNDPDARYDRLTQEVEASGADDGVIVPLLAPLLDIPSVGEDGSIRYNLPQYDRDLLLQKTIDAVIAWWTGVASSSPSIVLLEDLHWSDRSTMQVVERLVSSDAIPGLLLVVTTRPELAEKSRLGLSFEAESISEGADIEVHRINIADGLEIGSHQLAEAEPSDLVDSVTALRLGKLDDASVAQLIDTIPSTGGVSDDRRRRIIELADGVPLFVEELVRSGSDLPETIEQLLQKRVQDSGDDLQLLQIASVIGARRVRVPLLTSVIESMSAEEGRVPSEDLLSEPLDRLVDLRLLDRRRTGDADRYRFRHALIRDAAYQTIAEDERPRIHGHVAEQMESGAAGPDPNPAMVALHYERAGNALKALQWYGAAATASFAAGAATEAIDAVNKALAIVDSWPDSPDKSLTQMQFLMLRGGSYQSLEGYGSQSAYDDFSRAQTLSDSLRERFESAGLVMALNAYRTVRGERHEADRLVAQQEAILDSTRESNPEAAALFEADVDFNKGLHVFVQGDWNGARTFWERSIHGPNGFEHREQRLWEGQTPPNDPHVGAYAQLIPVYWNQGEMSKALEAYQSAMEIADSLPFPHGPFMRAYTHSYMGWVYQFSDNNEMALAEFGAAAHLGTEHGFVFWQAFGGLGATVAQLHMQLSPENLGILDYINAEAAKANTWMLQPYYRTQRAWFRAEDDPEGAIVAFDEALELAADKQEQFYDSMARVLKARVLIDLGRGEEARDELLAAHGLALKQGAHAFRLEAAALMATAVDESLRPDGALEMVREAVGGIVDDESHKAAYPRLETASQVLT